MARGLGVVAPASSPTYGLVHRYPGRRGPVFHLDCYRLKHPEEAEDLDWESLLREGDVIAAGHDAALDELRHIATHTDAFLLELEARERERAGIPGLKLGFNRVQGFFIEVSRKDAERVPTDYVRRQTVKSAERFITTELKSFEDKVLSARERALARERGKGLR